MFFKQFSLLVAASTAFAYDFSHWSPAGSDDSRGPCPALNTLANHGILPHDGKGLTVPALVDSLTGVYNVEKTLATVLAVGGLLISPHPTSLKYNLADLDRHNAIEHDGSLTRADFNEGGDDHTFNPQIFAEFMSHFDGLESTTLETSAKARFARIKNSSDTNPDFKYTPLTFFLSYAETVLYIKALGQGSDNVPIGWMQSFFVDEKLPVDQGWQIPEQSFGLGSVLEIIPQMVTASGDQIPEGVVMSKNAIVRAMLGLEEIKQQVDQTIQNLLDRFGITQFLQGIN